MSISAAINVGVVVTDTLATADAPLIDSGDTTLKESLKSVLTLTGTTSPAVTLHAAMQVALSAGTATVDFTALTKRGGVPVSFSGKTVRQVVFQNPNTNANSITIAQGGSNALALLGATYSLTLAPGQTAAFDFGAAGAPCDATHKNVALTGTGSQVLNILGVAG